MIYSPYAINYKTMTLGEWVYTTEEILEIVRNRNTPEYLKEDREKHEKFLRKIKEIKDLEGE